METCISKDDEKRALHQSITKLEFRGNGMISNTRSNGLKNLWSQTGNMVKRCITTLKRYIGNRYSSPLVQI